MESNSIRGLPPQESFEALYCPRIHRDDWLVVKCQFFILESISQLGFQKKSTLDLLVHRAVKELTASLTLAFRTIHRDIGILKHRLRRYLW